jgi:predicted small secreted protein
MLSDIKVRLGLVALPTVLGLALLTSGCNTMRGMGEDVQAAGGAMSGTAESTEEKIEEEMSDEEMDDDMEGTTTTQ